MAGALVVEPPRRALAIYAHPDDSDVSCGATLARWAAEGCVVHVVVCAMGDKGSLDPATDPVELAARRRGECAAAAAILGVSGLHHLAHSDGELENDRVLRGELVALIRALRPDVVVCPDPLAVFFGEHYYNHRDHRVVGFAALDAVAPAAASPLYFPEAGPAHGVGTVYLSGSLEPNVYVEVTGTIDQKAEAVLRHESQLGGVGEGFRDVIHARAEEAGRMAGVRFAEAFRRLDLSE